MKNVQVGDKLIAVNTCTMVDSREEALIVGKTYVVKTLIGDGFIIHSELGLNHRFKFCRVGIRGDEIYFIPFYVKNIFQKI